MDRIYSKSGDRGETSLLCGKKVRKDHLRLHAAGSLDELNSFLGLFCSFISEKEISDEILFIQNKILNIVSIVSCDNQSISIGLPTIIEDDILFLEKRIDKMSGELSKMKKFIIPNGNMEIAFSNVCRTLCRKAERYLVCLNSNSPIQDHIIVFINRLSDYLFVLTRKLIKKSNKKEIIWNPNL